jgi:uncharacterized protein
VFERIEAGYREKFRTLLARVRPRRLDFGVELLVGRARAASQREGIPLPEALARLYETTRTRVDRRVALMAACQLEPPSPAAPLHLLCDASLGGLARWLRAAGYEADWRRDLAGVRLIEEARTAGATLVTTDSRLAAHPRLRTGEVPVVWIPSCMTRVEQLRMAVADLGLDLRQARCMRCGGELAAVAKEDVLERIPPRTRAWKDEYFECRSCRKLYWQGTHWERIAARLSDSTAPRT